MHVGLDFGTTTTVASVFDGTKIHFIPIETEDLNQTVMRSALLISRAGEVMIGKAAIDYYTKSNVGREIVYEQVTLGTIEMHFADMTMVKDVHAMVDANAPARLFLSLKTALRDASYTTTDVFGAKWSMEQLVAVLLREVKRRIEEHLGQSITSMTIGRPVHYAATPEGDALALGRMQSACDLAELPNVHFLPEPVAAAHSFIKEVDDESTVFVFDFGGGTLDTTVMLIDLAGQREVLATGGVAIGGDLLDSRIVTGALLPYFGAGARFGPRRRELPAYIFEDLADWQSIVELSRPRTLEIIENAVHTSDRPQQLRALRSLVRENYGLPLFAEVEQAKRRLSGELQTDIAMDAGEIHFRHQLLRIEFERLIGPEARTIGACIEQTLQDAGLRPDQVDIVLRTGGSSRIPRFVRLLSDIFGAERVREVDAFTSVGAGLGVAAWERVYGPAETSTVRR